MLGESRNNQEKPASLPGIRISSKWSLIYIFKSTIEALGRPHYVRFLIHPKKRLLSIVGSPKKERNSFPVPPRLFDNAGSEFKMGSKLLTQQIYEIAGWESGCTHRVSGTYQPHLAAVVFELREAERTS